MEYEEMCKYIHEEGGRIHKITMDLIDGFQKTEEKFMGLSAKLFSKKYTKYFSQIIPEEYYPWNVSERVQNSVDLTARHIYEEAIKVYELALLPTHSKIEQ